MNKFKIPTLLGLGIIFSGIASGLYLVLSQQVYLSQAAPNLTPKNITITNITEDSVVISWQTNSPTASFITFGQKAADEETVLDDRDNNLPASVGPKPHQTHYVTLKNLLPKTTYLFKIISGKLTSDPLKFEAAAPPANKSNFTPVIGSVLDEDTPLNDGIVYLAIGDAIVQSALVKTGGNFLIPLSQVSKADLTDTYPLTEDTTAKLIIRSNKGDTTVSFKLKANSAPLPPIKVGQNIDLTTIEETPLPVTTSDLEQYDLNGDGKLNAADYAILTSCLGKRLNTILIEGKSCAKADINRDGVINQKDIDLIPQKLKELGSS